jgi:hypothetical protein
MRYFETSMLQNYRPIGLVNRQYPDIANIRAVKSYAESGQPPELFVIAAPAAAVLGIAIPPPQLYLFAHETIE